MKKKKHKTLKKLEQEFSGSKWSALKNTELETVRGGWVGPALRVGLKYGPKVMKHGLNGIKCGLRNAGKLNPKGGIGGAINIGGGKGAAMLGNMIFGIFAYEGIQYVMYGGGGNYPPGAWDYAGPTPDGHMWSHGVLVPTDPESLL